MPKEGKTNAEWKERLQQYAAGSFRFGKGQKPPPQSPWSKAIEQIDKCPKKNRSKDLFGKAVLCNCGYHLNNVSDNHSLSSVKSILSVAADTETSRPTLIATSGNKEAIRPSEVLDNRSLSSVKPILSVAADTETPRTTLIAASGNKEAIRPSEESSRKCDYSSRLPMGWKETLDPNDINWIAHSLFATKGVLVCKLKTWWFPPEIPGPQENKIPLVSDYFHRRLFLWMPRKMWASEFKCPCCPIVHSLTSKGLYNRVRSVIDLKNRYYLATEYLECSSCKGTFLSYDYRLLQQLPDDVKARFPVVLTRKFAADQSIAALLRARTIGNSPTALCNDIHELHTEEWMRNTVAYLSDCKRHKTDRERMKQPSRTYDSPPELKNPPTPKWFLAIYVRDVWARLAPLKAGLTSVYGSILKIDSTKKVARKLQGKASDSVSWCTNVGNERGEVLMSILTTSESLANLDRMAQGLMDRYEKASQPNPLVLYTDRDCCKSDGPSKFQKMFHRWNLLIIRLDSWHFMRRLSCACTNESHPLYGTFMSQISAAIFEWDHADVELLKKAKVSELQIAGIKIPSAETVLKAISKQELARHCRRKTRSVTDTTSMLEKVFSSLLNATDTLGVPLLKEDAMAVLNTESRHVPCLQDPTGVQLYTKVDTIKKGNVSLPVYRCGRGTTSLESFHSHIKNFIPGTSANDLHFQAFLLDGLSRWNTARAAASIEAPTHFRSFDTKLQGKLDQLSSYLFGKSLDINYRPPSTYTGEVFGVEYLYTECGTAAPTSLNDIDDEIEEETAEDNFYCHSPVGIEELDPELDLACATFIEASELNASDDEEECSTDLRSIPGWDKVDKLSAALVNSTSLSVTKSEAENVVRLYEDLSDFDKIPLKYTRILKPSRGRFGRSKNNSGHVGQEAMRRCFITAGSPSLPPTKSRIVEAICLRLSLEITSPDKDPQISRYRKIVNRYNQIRLRIMDCPSILEKTGLSLFPINETRVNLWLKNKTRISEVQLLLQGIQLPELPITSFEALPLAKEREMHLAQPSNPFVFAEPEDRTGLAKVRKRLLVQKECDGQAEEIEISDQATEVQQAACNQVLVKPAIPKTTAWRKRKAELESQSKHQGSEPNSSSSQKIRKEYTCKNCDQPMTSQGHTQYRGQRYCPKDNPLSKTEWLEGKRVESKSKIQVTNK